MHPVGVKTHRLGTIRCTDLYQGVATRNGATTREILPPSGRSDAALHEAVNFALLAISEVCIAPALFTRASYVEYWRRVVLCVHKTSIIHTVGRITAPPGLGPPDRAGVSILSGGQALDW